MEPIAYDVYLDFATHHFREAGKDLAPDAFLRVYEVFMGVTLYVQRIMKDAFSETPNGQTCDVEAVNQLIEDYIDENDSRLREQLAYITEAQKELLYAIHAEKQVQGITSTAFKKEKTYSISDPLMKLWLDRRKV